MAGHTKGPWYLPHFADDTCKCDCTSVVGESFAGAICTIQINNGLSISDGGNDAAPLDEAQANARLIASAPDLLALLIESQDNIGGDWRERRDAVITKAIGVA